MKATDYIDLEAQYCAHNYASQPVVMSKGEGVWIWDTDGKKYLDMLSGYSAVSHGHCHPKILETLRTQSSTLTLNSRACYNDQLGRFMEKLCHMTGMDMGLPMNTGAEAVETAIKGARRWGYRSKGIPENKARIIVAQNNFHGRTSTIVSFSSDPDYKKDFGPLMEGFDEVPFGDLEAVKKAITPHTCAILVEPIQGEGGIIVPPMGYIKGLRELADSNNILLILDEVQSGLGRTGRLLDCNHENVLPHGLILGKALGGGVFPISAFLATREVMQHFTPGSHGSTFGGNPLGCAIGYRSLEVLEEENLIQNSHLLGGYFMEALKGIPCSAIKEIRGRGLWVGIEFYHDVIPAKQVTKMFLKEGLLTKETHETVIRLAPPLVITQEQLDYGIERIRRVLELI